MPASFTDEREKACWDESQDIAYRAGFSLILRDHSTWAVSDDAERLICTPADPDRVWLETWRILVREYPDLLRTRGARDWANRNALEWNE